MRSDSELFILYLVAGKDGITTEEVKQSLLSAINDRDSKNRLRFGLGHETISEMLMSFLGRGWVDVTMPPGDPECGKWKLSDIGLQILTQAPHDLQARLGFQPAAT